MEDMADQGRDPHSSRSGGFWGGVGEADHRGRPHRRS